MIPLSIASGMIACWMLGILHPAIIGFIGCFLFLSVSGLEFEQAFAGFGTEVPWFFYGVLLLSIAAERSGIVATLRARSPRVLKESAVAAAAALVVLAYASAPVVPSSLARAGLLIIVASAWGPSPWLAIAAGYAASAFGHTDLAGGARAVVGWDAAVMTAIVAAVALGTRWWSTPAPEASTSRSDAALAHRALAIPVTAATLLWLTTSLHGMSPALVGLGCGLACLVPGIAPPGKHPLDANHLAIIFVGTAMTIPMVLEDTKAAELLVHEWTTAAASMGKVGGYWMAVVYRLFGPEGARVGLPSLAPALDSSARWAYAGATMISLHQSPALMLAYAVGGARPKQIAVVGAMVLLLGSVVVLVF